MAASNFIPQHAADGLKKQPDCCAEEGDCLRGLQYHHQIRAHGNIPTPQVGDAMINGLDGASEETATLTGRHIESIFSRIAEESLDAIQMQQLLEFLHAPVKSNSSPKGLSDMEMNTKLQAFFDAELAESGGDISLLSKPAGPVDADVAILLHIQTRDGQDGDGPAGDGESTDGTARSFWNVDSPTIQALAQKGFNDQFTFCYDWHWRAEASMYGRGRCSTNAWSVALQKLHNEMSASLLSLLGFRFLIVGGACPRKHYLKTPSYSRKILELPLTSDTNLEFALEFNADALQRITVFADHPSAMFLSNTKGRQSACWKLEACSNLFLWLLGRPHDSFAMRALHSKCVPSRGFAPISEMWLYVQAEQNAHDAERIMSSAEYDASFLGWAKRYLGEGYEKAVLEKKGIASACGAKWQAVAQAGRETNFYKRQAIMSIDKDAAKVSHQSQRQNDDSILLAEKNDLLDTTSGTRLPAAVAHNVPALPSKQASLTYSEHRSQYNRNLNRTRYGTTIRELWNGQHVKISSNGMVRLFISSDRRALILRASNSAAKRIINLGNQAIINFSVDWVSLTVDGELIYRRPTRDLRCGNDGSTWALQIDKECRAKGI